MMEKVVLPPFQPRLTNDEIREKYPWATLGKPANRKPNIITSLELDSALMEQRNLKLQKKYREIEKNEVRFEEIDCEDAEYLLIAFGSSARICEKTVELAREKGIKLGLFRPITLFPFPTNELKAYANKVKAMLTMELNAGQMVEDVRLAVNGKIPVEHYGRMGGIIPTGEEILEVTEKLIANNQ
nr:3-methyl-2-oxobutanoate dehydrogenase subunit beta [Paludibacteraceae bacterium]